MPPRVTLREIALRCHCTTATVSRALRNFQSISPATRQRVQAAAAALNYVPDPALSALVEHRRGLRQTRFVETLTVLSPELSWAESRRLPHRAFLIETMRERARTLGYTLDFFHVPPTPRDLQEAARLLRRRRIRGVIIVPSTPPPEELSFPWGDFAVVKLSRNPIDSRITSVGTDISMGVHLVTRRLAGCGYRRPGLVMPAQIASHTAGEWSLFLRAVAAMHEGVRPVADLTYEQPVHGPPALPALRAWLDAEQPDVILGFEAPALAQSLTRAGWGVPDRVALIDLDIGNLNRPGIAGLLQSRIAIGRTAIDYLHSLLLTNSLGFPDHPVTIKTACKWVDGPSMRNSA